MSATPQPVTYCPRCGKPQPAPPALPCHCRIEVNDQQRKDAGSKLHDYRRRKPLWDKAKADRDERIRRATEDFVRGTTREPGEEC